MKKSERYKESARAWRQRPETKAKQKAYRKAWMAIPENRAKEQARKQTPEYKMKARLRERAWRQTTRGNSIWKKCQLKHFYGLDHAEWVAMRDAQNGICAISGCGRQANNVDHSHATGRVRALLCRDCNLALGMLRDCPDRIAGLAEYASKHSLSRYEDVRVISKKAEQPELFALDEVEGKP